MHTDSIAYRKLLALLKMIATMCSKILITSRFLPETRSTMCNCAMRWDAFRRKRMVCRVLFRVRCWISTRNVLIW